MKLMICGHAHHGKDTVAEILCESVPGIYFNSASILLGQKIFEDNTLGYASFQEFFDNRSKHRAHWFSWIKEFNRPLYRAADLVYFHSSIYVGMRARAEFEAVKARHKPLIIWVDASHRLPPESSASMEISADMCDIIISNNESLDRLRERVKSFAKCFSEPLL